MYWTLELASKLEDAPWPATKDELIDYATRSGAPLEVIENLEDLEDDGEVYESIEEIWPDYPSKEDFFFNEDEYYTSPNGRLSETVLEEIGDICREQLDCDGQEDDAEEFAEDVDTAFPEDALG